MVMKFISKKALVLCIWLMMLLSVCPVSAAAQESVQPEQSQEQIMPRSDIIVTQLRTNSDGQVEKRRWNTSKQCWYDRYWVLLSQPFPGE